MPVTNRIFGNSLVSWLLFGGISFVWISNGLAGSEGVVLRERSLARVVMKFQYSGLVHGEQVISQSTVVEVSEFNGVVVDTEGYIVSYVGGYWSQLQSPNAKFFVEFAPERVYPAELVGVDERVYVGVFRSKGAKKRAIPFGSAFDWRKELQLVSWIGGNWGGVPLKILRTTERTFLPEKELKGEVCDCSSSQYARVGSVALDAKGRLVGLVSQSKKTGFNQRISLYRILPVSVLRDSVKQVVERHGSVHAGWLGVSMDPETEKVRIEEVVDNSPAARGGLQIGDHILKVNDQNVSSKMDLVKVIRWAGPESSVDLTVSRDGEIKTLTSVLDEHPILRKPQLMWAVEIPKVWPSGQGEAQAKEIKLYQMPAPSAANFGFVLDPLTPQLAKYFKTPNEKGLLVKSVMPGSAASKLGFLAGDVIYELNETPLRSGADIKTALDSAKDGSLLIKFVRDGEILKKQVVIH
jgi:S1-C subfamily serine protease